MTDTDTRFRNQVLQVIVDSWDGLHAVVHEENLSAPIQLADNGFPNQFGRVGSDVCDDWQPFFRRTVDCGDVAHATERHIERTGNGRGRHGQHVHFFAHLLEMFFVSHAEALLFINNQQTQVLEMDVRGYQAVGADDDINLFGSQIFDDFFLLFMAAKAREHFYFDRKD